MAESAGAASAPPAASTPAGPTVTPGAAAAPPVPELSAKQKKVELNNFLASIKQEERKVAVRTLLSYARACVLCVRVLSVVVCSTCCVRTRALVVCVVIRSVMCVCECCV